MRAALLLLAAPAVAEPVTWSCQPADGAAFEVRFDAGDPPDVVHCVTSPALAGRAPGCAPDGGWGISAAGDDTLIALVRDPSAVEGMHGWLFATVTPTTFFAAASETDRTPITLEIAYGTFWRMRMDLATGEGREFDTAGSRSLVCTQRP